MFQYSKNIQIWKNISNKIPPGWSKYNKPTWNGPACKAFFENCTVYFIPADEAALSDVPVKQFAFFLPLSHRSWLPKWFISVCFLIYRELILNWTKRPANLAASWDNGSARECNCPHRDLICSYILLHTRVSTVVELVGLFLIRSKFGFEPNITCYGKSKSVRHHETANLLLARSHTR